MRNAEIKAALAEAQAKQLEKADISATRVLEELGRLAFSDVRELFDGAGKLRSLKALTASQAAAIASVELVRRNLTAGDGAVDEIHKIKLWDKVRALEMLFKHLGLLEERIRVDLGGFEDRLTAARKRLVAPP